MSKSLKISIITVCYNSAEYFEKAIESVLLQDYDNFEYIVIDGGSTDGTQDIIRKYEDRLAYWSSEPEKGLYDAIHKGLEKASGEIIGMINTNDYYSPGVFKMVANAYKCQSFNHTVVWGDVMYEDRRIIGWNARNTSLGTFAPHPSMFCPKSVYTRTNNYSMCYKVLSDYEFMYRAIDYHNINYVYMPELFAFLRSRELTFKNILPSLKEELSIQLRYGQPKIIAYSIFLFKIIKNSPKILKNMFCKITVSAQASNCFDV